MIIYWFLFGKYLLSIIYYIINMFNEEYLIEYDYEEIDVNSLASFVWLLILQIWIFDYKLYSQY